MSSSSAGSSFSAGSSAGSTAGLDETVFPLRGRLQLAGVPDPEVLFLMGTGSGFLPGRLADVVEVELGELCSGCEPWSVAHLWSGRLGGVSVWLLDDVSGAPLADEPSSPWVRALPVWLAAAAGAHVLVHCSAGSALAAADGSPAVPPRSIAALRDHLNLSGTTPLLGLGESKLGPLFPDLSRLHHTGLRGATLARGAALGIRTCEAIAACTLGPALETPAERAMLARLGAEISVPDLATPLLAAGHAGLAVLALVAVTDASAEIDVQGVVAAAAALQPALEDLVLALVPDLEAAVADLAREVSA